MRRQKAVITLVIVTFVLVGIGYGSGFYLVRKYKKKTEELEEQNQLMEINFKKVERNLQEFKLALDNLGGGLKEYVGKFNAIEERINTSEAERKDIFSAIESIKSNTQILQKEYSAAAADFKERIDNLTTLIQADKQDIKTVELGEISVKKEGDNK